MPDKQWKVLHQHCDLGLVAPDVRVYADGDHGTIVVIDLGYKQVCVIRVAPDYEEPKIKISVEREE